MRCVYHLWPARLYQIIPHYLIKTQFSKKKNMKIKCMFLFSLQISSDTFLILRRIERDMIKHAVQSNAK